MRRMIVALLILALLIALIVYSQFAFGKYETIEEAVTEGIPYEVSDMVHIQKIGETEKTGEVVVVAYTVEPDEEHFPSADFEGLGIQFLAGNEEEGWEFLHPSGWGHYGNDDLVMETDVARVETEQGERLLEVYVSFGAVYDPAIERVVYTTKDHPEFREAQIIVSEAARYVFIIGKLDEFRGLSESGEIISAQG